MIDIMFEIYVCVCLCVESFNVIRKMCDVNREKINALKQKFFFFKEKQNMKVNTTFIIVLTPALWNK